MSERENYSALLSELDRLRTELIDDGIQISSFDESISKLKDHTTNIEKVEANIEAIQEEVIEPIKQQLNENKKAGKFSVYGFYAGGVGILLSIFSVIYSSLSTDSQVENAQVQLYAQAEQMNAVNERISQIEKEQLRSKWKQDQISLLLYKSISEVASERRGSVDELLRTLDDADIDHNFVLHFYLMHLPSMLSANNENGVMYATLVLSKLPKHVLKEEKDKIEQFYSEIYDKPDWDRTSEYYEEVASKAQILLNGY